MAARHLAEAIDVHDGFSAARQFLALLGMPRRYVDGPARRSATSWNESRIPRAAFERARRDTIDFIRRNARLPDARWLDARRISLADFAATLAGDEGGQQVQFRPARLTIEGRISSDPVGSCNWIIHSKGFAPENLLELARLQAWTLKPPKLKR